MTFFKDLIAEVQDENTSMASDGLGSAEFGGFIDTGSYMLNAVLSGSIFGGVPDNKVTAFAGESATGKSYFVLGVVKSFLDSDKTAGVVYYDTEAAITRDMMESRGIDTDRVIISEPDTIQKFKTHALKMIEAYEKQPEDKRPRMMFVLDSLGLLSTTKEMEDSLEGKDTRDMTKAQTIKAAFRVLTLKLAKVKVPMLVTNHVYDVIGCLDESQIVQMADGSTKRITDILIGDVVATESGGKPVSALYQYDVDEYYEMELEDGSVIKATPNHKFKTTAGEWKCIDELSDSDELALFDIESTQLVSGHV
jgi:RecA/RadA recombinase